MRLLGRLILVPLALIFAIPAGVVGLIAATVLDPVLGAFGFEFLRSTLPALVERMVAQGDPEALLDHVSGAANLAAMLLIVPPAFVALLGELAGFRAFLWYAGATGAVAGLMPWLWRSKTRPATPEELHITGVLFVGGLIAGAVYWLIAGSSAGRRPPRPLPSGSPS